MSLSYSSLPSPIQPVQSEVLDKYGIRFFIKRDDLIHPHISGNKWRKLKHNLLRASFLNKNKLLTFGGAYSNHLAATAAAGKTFGFSTVGVVRGEEVLPLNPTLSFTKSCGMELVYVSRTDFRQLKETQQLDSIGVDADQFYILPEGGSNCLALDGVAEMVTEITAQLGSTPDYICTACGTGATMAGIVKGMEGHGQAIGFSVLKGDFMTNEVNAFLEKCGAANMANWHIENGFHFGGYAKFKPELVDFINQFKIDFGIPLDPIYTGKLAYGIFDLLKKGYFKKGETIVMVHTGGLQGVAGFNERFGGLIK